MQVPITNTEFVRDLSTSAVLNTDSAGLQAYQQARRRLLDQKHDHRTMCEQITQLEQGLCEMRAALAELARLTSPV